VGKLAKFLSAVAVLALTARVALLMEPGLDYFSDAGGSIDALVRRDFDGFFASQPLMGSVSLLLRAPFVAAVFYSSESTVYLAGALPCVFATLALGMALGRLAAERGASQAVQGIVTGLAVINPVTFRALHWGHPEELLTAALCVGAVLAALRNRQIVAAVLLGLALASKQWAVLAVLPVLLAAEDRQLLIASLAAGLAAALTLPMYLSSPGAFETVAQSAAGRAAGGTWTTPWNLWWPIAEVMEPAGRGPTYVAPGWVGQISHPLIVAMGPLLAGLLWLRKDRRRDDALLLLALLFLLRCLLDQWNNDYYHAPFLASLLAWEVVRFGGVPYRTLGFTLLHALSFFPQQTQVFRGSFEHASILNALYLMWVLPFTAYLAAQLLAPNAGRAAWLRPGPGFRGRAHPSPVPADMR